MVTRVFASVSGSLKECETIPMDEESRRQILRNNLNVIFPNLIVMEHGYHASSTVFNTLAYDTDRERFVVVEYARGKNGLADRITQYASELEKTPHQTHLLALCKTRLASGSPERWPGAYVIVLADHFPDHDKNLAQQNSLDMPTELHLVQRPNSNAVAIESINAAQVQVPSHETSVAVTKPPRRRGRPAKGTMGSLLSKRSDKIKDLGFALEAALEKLQLKSHVPKSGQYARFKYGAITVCAVSITRGGLRLYYPVEEKADESGFVYGIRHQLGEYASDINTLDDIRLALPVVRAAYDFLVTRSTSSGASGGAKVPKSDGGTSTKPDAKFTFYMDGQKFEAGSAIGALRQIFDYLPQVDPRFLENFDKLEYGGKRRYVARDKKLLHSPGFAHPEQHAYAIQSAPGWWLGTNYDRNSIMSIALLARETVDPNIGRTMYGDIFATAQKHPGDTASTLRDKRTAYKTDGGLVIPESENASNEFKSSFRYDYKIAEFERQGDRDGVNRQREMIRKHNFGHGLEWDIAKAIAGFSNSYIEKGRIWVGIREIKGSKPVVLGLDKDREKSKSTNMEDDFGNWITALLKNCIRDYTSFDNIKISYPYVDGRQICVLEVTPASQPMFLFAKDDPNNTVFYKRDRVTARTDQLSVAVFNSYVGDRFAS